jgi:hypothetical protein
MTTKTLLLPAAAALALAPAAILSSSSAANPRAPVYVAAEGCQGHLYKPRKKVILACADANLYVTGLRYSSYGSREAKGSGVFHLNDCTPDCAGGRFHEHGGSIRFFDVVACADGRRYFARARYSFPGRGGKGTADVAPFVRCKSKRS